MIVLDAGGLIAFFTEEPGAGEVEALLHDAVMTATNAAGALDTILRRGADPSALEERWAALIRSGLRVRAVDERLAWAAASLRARRYHRRTNALSLADCILIAAARPGDEVASSDGPVIATARAEGVAVRPLLDSRGVRPG